MTKGYLILAAALALAVCAPRAQASSVSVWENVWDAAGSVQVVDSADADLAYDDTQFTLTMPGSGTGGGCRINEDCNDNDFCTTDTCEFPSDVGQCVHVSVTCDDNNVCNGPEACNPSIGCVPGGPVDSNSSNLTESLANVVVIGLNCDDGIDCTADSCDPVDGCLHAPMPCSDNNACTTDTCDLLEGCVGTPVVCGDDNNACTTSTCDPVEGCVSVPDDNVGACDDGDACTSGTTCSGGVCTGGSTLSCDDSDTCTVDACDAVDGCVYNVATESPSCGSCDDGVDNDDDGDADAEDCACSTLCAQQRFAVVSTFVPSKLTRYALYSGSDVTVNDSSDPLPYPSGGICQTNGDYRAGANVGHIAATGSSRFGKGAALDPDLVDEEGEDDIDTGSDRVTIVRQTYDSDGDAVIIKDSPPYVGPGSCSQDAMMACNVDSDCGMGNDCENQLTLTDVGNTFVTTNGTGENYGRCVNAQLTVQPEADAIEALAGNVAGYNDGTEVLKTSASQQLVEVTVGAGQQVVHVRRVAITGKTTLRFRRDPMAVGDPTVLVIRVARGLRLGGEAQVELVGIDAGNVIWNAEGPTGGRPKMLRSSHFRGTLLAAERRGISTGGLVTVDGALKGRRVHLGQSTTINHVPFKALLQ